MGKNTENKDTVCSQRDCFGYESGHCGVLEDTDFKGKKCPFYCEKNEMKERRQSVLDDLFAKGRTDIIENYYGKKVLKTKKIPEPKKGRK